MPLSYVHFLQNEWTDLWTQGCDSPTLQPININGWFWADGNTRIPPTNIPSRSTFWSRYIIWYLGFISFRCRSALKNESGLCFDADPLWKMHSDYVLMQIRSEKCIRIMFWCRSALKNRSGLCFDADPLWKMHPDYVLMQIWPEKWIYIMFWCRSALKNESGLWTFFSF